MSEQCFVFLEGGKGGKAQLFEDAHRVVCACDPGEVRDKLREVADAHRAGYFVAGFVGFEYGRLASQEGAAANAPGLPYFCFGLFKKRRLLGARELEDWLVAQAPMPSLTQHKDAVSRRFFVDQIRHAGKEMRAKSCGLLDYRLGVDIRYSGNAAALYRSFRERIPAETGALLCFPEITAIARSARFYLEKSKDALSIDIDEGEGFAPPEEMALMGQKLKEEGALMRHRDLVEQFGWNIARLEGHGAIETQRLCEPVESAWGRVVLRSTMKAAIKSDTGLDALVDAFLPNSAMTGFPDDLAASLIEGLENGPRGVYGGMIGALDLKNEFWGFMPECAIQSTGPAKAVFSLGTIMTPKRNPGEVYAKIEAKLSAVDRLPQGLCLRERVGVHPQKGARNMERHLKRMAQSSRHFSFVFDKQEVKNAILQKIADLDYEAVLAIEYSRNGELRLEIEPQEKTKDKKRIAIAEASLSSADPLLAHRTNAQAVFDEELARAQDKQEVVDVVFFNEHGHLARGARHNIMIKEGDRFLTPARECGASWGVALEKFANARPDDLVEGKISRQEFEGAKKVFLISSANGRFGVELMGAGKAGKKGKRGKAKASSGGSDAKHAGKS